RIASAVRSATRSHQRAETADITKMWHAVPPPEEQSAIATFLDRETADIDALIAKKERLIELLHENRAALIATATTRGLNATAVTKFTADLGFQHAPAHWDVRRLKSTVQTRQNGVWGEDPGGIHDLPCIRAADFDRITFRANLSQAP